MSPETHPGIPPDLYLNGIILSVPWGGHQEFEVMWDAAQLPVALSKSDLRNLILKSDTRRVAFLKISHSFFDKLYPNGPKGVVNISVPTQSKEGNEVAAGVENRNRQNPKKDVCNNGVEKVSSKSKSC